MRTIVLPVLLLLIAVLSCEQGGDFTPKPDPELLDVIVLDTFRIETSTLITDSIVTSSVPRLLAGQAFDPGLGQVKSSSYFKLSPSASLDFEDRLMAYDSLYLILHFDGYASGKDDDSQGFSVREVREEYGTEFREFYYGFERLNYSRGALGYFDYNPDWEAGDTVAVKLSDELGLRLFELAKDGDLVLSNEDFVRELEGLVIVPEQASPGRMVGFTNSSNPTGIDFQNQITLRMYYHDEAEFDQSFTFDFHQVQEEIAFNLLESDRTNTALEALSGDNAIAAELAGERTFVQGGTGIQTKIRFPYLKRLNQLDEEYAVHSAVLRIEAIEDSYRDGKELPDSLALYITDKYHEVSNVIYSTTASAALSQRAGLQVDDERGLYAYYEFNVTEFVFLALQAQEIHEPALLLAPTARSILGTIDQLQIGGENYSEKGVTLKIYMTRITL